MAKANMLVDSFGDNVRDPALWDAYGGPEAEVNKRLEIRLQSGVSGYGGYSSVDVYDLTGSQVSVELVRVPRAVPAAEVTSASSATTSPPPRCW